jgi:hypothetical protein
MDINIHFSRHVLCIVASFYCRFDPLHMVEFGVRLCVGARTHLDQF